MERWVTYTCLHGCCASHGACAQAGGVALVVGLVVSVDDVLLVDGLVVLILQSQVSKYNRVEVMNISPGAG